MPATVRWSSISPVIDGYIICTTPRSGSTLLCSLLDATGQAGHPWSFYHQPDFMQEWAEAWGLPDAASMPLDEYDRAYLQATVAAGRGATSLFGMRLQQPYLAPLLVTLARLYPDAASGTERFERAFGSLRYVHLVRQDKVAQAVSLVKATQSGLWHRNADGTERERSGPVAEPVYDAAAIRAGVASLTQADRGWCDWFEANQIEPLRVTYEMFAYDPVATVSAICAALGVALTNEEVLVPAVARLTDRINLEWTARYRAEAAAVQ